jgi:hypothetical protein
MQLDRFDDAENWITAYKEVDEAGKSTYSFFTKDETYLDSPKNAEWFQGFIRELHLDPNEPFLLNELKLTPRDLMAYLNPAIGQMKEFTQQLAKTYDQSEWGIEPGIVYDDVTGQIASGKVHEEALKKMGLSWTEDAKGRVFMRLKERGSYMAEGLYIVDYAPWDEGATKRAVRKLMSFGLPGDTPIYNEMDVNIGMAKDFAGAFVTLDRTGEMADLNELLGRYNPYTREQLLETIAQSRAFPSWDDLPEYGTREWRERVSSVLLGFYDEFDYLKEIGAVAPDATVDSLFAHGTQYGSRAPNLDAPGLIDNIFTGEEGKKLWNQMSEAANLKQRARYADYTIEDLEGVADGSLVFENQDIPRTMQRTTGVFDYNRNKWVFDIGGDHWSLADKNKMNVDIQLVRNPADNKVYLNINEYNGDDAVRAGAQKLIDLGADPSIQVNVVGTRSLDGDTTLGDLAGIGWPVEAKGELAQPVGEFLGTFDQTLLDDIDKLVAEGDGEAYLAYDFALETGNVGYTINNAITGLPGDVEDIMIVKIDLDGVMILDDTNPETAALWLKGVINQADDTQVYDRVGREAGTIGDLRARALPAAAVEQAVPDLVAEQAKKIDGLVAAWDIQNSDTMGTTNANIFKSYINARGVGEGQLLGVYLPPNPDLEGDTGKLIWSIKAPMHQPIKEVAGSFIGLSGKEMFTYPNLLVGFLDGELSFSAADDVIGRQFGYKLIEMGAEPSIPTFIGIGMEESQWMTLGEFLGMGMKESDTTTQVVKEMWTGAKLDWRASMTERVNNETLQTIDMIDAWKAKADEAISMGSITRKAAVADREAFVNIVNQYKSQWTDGLEQASMKATGEVNRILFDYSVRNNMEELLRYYAPFTTWQLRNPFFWAQAMTSHPSLINVVAQYHQAAEIARKRRGLSDRFKDTIGFDVPAGSFIPAGYYAVKPTAIFSLASQMQSTFEPPSDFEAQGVNKYLQWLIQAGQSMGITPWPWISYGAEKVGAMQPGSTQLSIGPQQRAVELGLQATGLRQPGEGLFGYTTTSKFLTDYYINRRISEMEAEGSLTHAEALAALKNPDDPNFKIAKDWVNKYTLAMGTQGLFNPFQIKYASPGEETIRQLKGLEQEVGLTGQDRTNFELSYPYAQTYGLSMGTDQQLAYARLNAKYNQKFEGLHPWDQEYKDIAAQRAAEVDAIYAKTENVGLTREQITANYIAKPLPDVTDEAGKVARDFPGVLDRLRDVEPRAGDFMGAGGVIDWDTYNESLDAWLENIPQLSGEFGAGVTVKDYLMFKYRGATPERIAYDLYKSWRDDAWDYYASIKPSGDKFRVTLDWAVEQQYLKDIAAGFTPTEAQTLRTDNVVQWGRDGIPYEYTSKLLADLTGTQPLSQFASTVMELMGGVDAFGGDIYQALDYQLPGMFGAQDSLEKARANIQDYFYNLTPREKNQVRDFLGLPKGETFLQDMTDIEVLKAWSTISAQMFAQAHGVVIADMSGPLMSVPIKDALTEQEKTDLDRVRVDWFHYNEALASDKTPRWTDLMSKYYGNEDSAQSKFWAAISKSVLAGAAFDDPYLGPILNKMARTDLKFSEDQYAAALQHFLDYKQYLIDPEKSKIFEQHPDWLPLSQAEQDKFSEWKLTDMEMWKAAYNLVPWDYKLKARTQWQKEHPEIWQQLELYMLLSDAEKIKYPYYMYFYDPKDYKKYFGTKLPTQIDPAEAAAKSEKQAQAAWDYVQHKYKVSKAGIEANYTQAMTDVYGPTENQKVQWDHEAQVLLTDHRRMVLLLMNYYAMDDSERSKWKGDSNHFLEYQALLYYWKLPQELRNQIWEDVR